MKLIISGSRNLTDYEILRKAVFEWAISVWGSSDKIPLPINSWIDEIIHGDAKGIDTLAGRFAKEHKIDLTIMPANWEKYGKRAGPIRNHKMAEYGKKCGECCHVLAIPETTYGGTQEMITYCTKIGLDVTVYAKHLKYDAKPC